MNNLTMKLGSQHLKHNNSYKNSSEVRRCIKKFKNRIFYMLYFDTKMLLLLLLLLSLLLSLLLLLLLSLLLLYFFNTMILKMKRASSTFSNV